MHSHAYMSSVAKLQEESPTITDKSFMNQWNNLITAKKKVFYLCKAILSVLS